MRGTSVKEICWVTALTILCIACFPLNPLVLTGVLEPVFYLPAFILGWVVWAAGMVLVIAPIVVFKRRGGVPKGKSFVHTTRMVDSSIYAVVRHPQYLGGNIINIHHYAVTLSSLAICYPRYPRSCHLVLEH